MNKSRAQGTDWLPQVGHIRLMRVLPSGQNSRFANGCNGSPAALCSHFKLTAAFARKADYFDNDFRRSTTECPVSPGGVIRLARLPTYLWSANGQKQPLNHGSLVFLAAVTAAHKNFDRQHRQDSCSTRQCPRLRPISALQMCQPQSALARHCLPSSHRMTSMAQSA